MPLSMYQASVPVLVRYLETITTLLDKAEAYTAQQKFDPAVVLGMRLFPDMLPLAKQVTLACENAKNSCARFADQPAPKIEVAETSFDLCRERVAQTIAYLKSLDPALFDGSEDRIVHPMMRGVERTFVGNVYLLHIALPNFFFHVTTIYALLRHIGLNLGKPDYLEAIPVPSGGLA